jgi:adenine deaminase
MVKLKGMSDSIWQIDPVTRQFGNTGTSFLLFAGLFEQFLVEMSRSIFQIIFKYRAMPKRSGVGWQFGRPTLTHLLRICYDPFMDEMKRRKILSDVALGEVPPDTVIMNGTLFNGFTREFISNQAIWIKDGRIAYVGPDHDPPRAGRTDVIDVNGMVLLPGLIDGHTHLASTTSGVDEFVRHAIPGGTTTVVTETMDLPFVVGEDGLKYWVKAFEGQPIRIYYTAPPICGLTLSEETNALTAEDLLPYLKDPRCLGLGEIYWSNIFLPGAQGQRLLDLAAATLALGKRIEGHTAGASGRKLQAYTCFGVSSCHEPITEDEVMEKVRIGLWIMIREGSVRGELDQLREIFKRDIDFRRFVLCTDSVDAVDILDQGYLEFALKKALRLGVPPELAYAMVTLNPAEHFHLDDSIGSLSPGRMADLLVIPSPTDFSPQIVMCDGRTIYKEGRLLIEPKKTEFPEHLLDTLKIKDYTIPPLRTGGKIRAIELVTNLVTKEATVDLNNAEEAKEVIMAFALDRIGQGGSFLGYLKGFGLQRGAFGSTLNWDTGDMVVLGCDPTSITTVIERLKEIRGGFVYANSKDTVAELSAPVCGFLSPRPMEAISADTKRIEEVVQRNGVRWKKPILTLETLTTPAIPHIRITHNGYVRVKDRKILPVDV